MSWMTEDLHTHICGTNLFGKFSSNAGCGYMWDHKASESPSHDCPRCGVQAVQCRESPEIIRGVIAVQFKEDESYEALVKTQMAVL